MCQIHEMQKSKERMQHITVWMYSSSLLHLRSIIQMFAVSSMREAIKTTRTMFLQIRITKIMALRGIRT